jgi:hypothetical protein
MARQMVERELLVGSIPLGAFEFSTCRVKQALWPVPQNVP